MSIVPGDEVFDERGYYVVKSNEMIQRSRFSLTLIEQKIVMYLISKIKPSDTHIKPVELDIRKFCEVCGLDVTGGTYYGYIKDTVQTLRKKSMWIKLENGNELLFSWIDYAYINKGKGTISISLSQALAPYLVELKNKYTQFHLIYVLGMKSQYSTRLYEILKSYEGMRKKIFEIDALRELLDAENYSRFPDFRRFVLEPAIKEMELTDIEVTYEMIKKGRKVTHIVFSIRTLSGLEGYLSLQGIKRILDGDQQTSFMEEYAIRKLGEK